MDLREQPTPGAQRHPWELARMGFFRDVLDTLGPRRQWLDAGAGDGWLARRLHTELPSAELTCWDAFYSDGDIQRLSDGYQGAHYVRDAPTGSFDLITSLDVLEHVENEREFLAILADRLSEEGRLLVSVPAWPRLFTAHDSRLLHYRRYEPKQAAELLRSAGFRILREGGLFHSLIAARLAQKFLEKVRPPVIEEPDLGWRAPDWMTTLVLGALKMDNRLSETKLGSRLPGLSYWALCEKREKRTR